MKRICSGCGELIEANAGPRCGDCQRARNGSLRSREQRGYDWRWRELSTRRRKAFPICELRLEGCQFLAVDVDHRIPLRAGGRSIWSNAQSTCRSCHRRKTLEDRQRYPTETAA